MPDEKASATTPSPADAGKPDKTAGLTPATAAPQANGAAPTDAAGQAVDAAEGEKGAATSKPPTVEERLTAVESELDDLKTAVASLGAPQVTQSKHDGLAGFIAWFEQRFEL